MKIFSKILTELNNYLPIFPDSSVSRNKAPEELNEVLIHDAPNVWSKQAYL